MAAVHHLLLLLLLLAAVSAAVTADLAADKAALLAFRAAVGRGLKWNASEPTPCSWPGVSCADGRVIRLRLPGVYLVGAIPAGTITNLTALRTISLRLNRLSGPLPAGLGGLSALRNVYLQGNGFSGQVPPEIFSLGNLVRLNLADNNFSGEISPEYGKLKRLATLYLENNEFSGELPELNLPKLAQFNVSNNRLRGLVPAGLQGQKAAAFSGNSLCGGPLPPCQSQPNSTAPAAAGIVINKTPTKHRRLSGGAIAGIVVGCVVGLLLLLLLLVFCCRRRRSSPRTRSVDMAAVAKPPEGELAREKPANDGHGSRGGSAPAAKAAPAPVAPRLLFFGSAAKVFDLEDLLRASAEVLGKGMAGTTYKAVLEMGMTLAVKRLKDVTMEEREYREKIELVGSMEHRNLVPLRAYYYSKEEKLLVYDYLINGSLSALLHGNRGAGRTPLNWETRWRIALGVARGIEYLHNWGLHVSHGNIKSSNVLLTKENDARVSDFGLAHLVNPAPSPNRVAGYRAPEVTDSRRVSQQADVYSYGVLILELLTGKAPINSLLEEEGIDLPRWVQSVAKEEWASEVFDLELLRYQNVEEEMVQLLQLGIDCCAQYPDHRPFMPEVVRRIEELQQSELKPALEHGDDGSSRRTISLDGTIPPATHS